MTLPATGTLVSYPEGAVTSRGTVLHVESLDDGRRVVVVDATACHPVDVTWPDQGADRGVLHVEGSAAPLPIVECVVAATDGTTLHLGADIPVRKGTDGWVFVVAHIVPESADVVAGATVEVRVDAGYRRALSAGHSACHLASLALNAALAGAWSKEVPLDGNGNPNFDQLAIESSTILENGSLDLYRIGKSLRRKGFLPAALDDLSALEAAINAQLAEWVATDAPIEVTREDFTLTGRRYWQCALPGGVVSIPCGGTHIRSLGELSGITVSLAPAEASGAVELRMTTAVPAR